MKVPNVYWAALFALYAGVGGVTPVSRLVPSTHFLAGSAAEPPGRVPGKGPPLGGRLPPTPKPLEFKRPTEPPATAPPATEPPATEPSATEPPAQEPRRAPREPSQADAPAAAAAPAEESAGEEEESAGEEEGHFGRMAVAAHHGVRHLDVTTHLVATGMNTVMAGITCLAVAYFCVFTALAVLRVVGHRYGDGYGESSAQKVLEMAETAVAGAPMLCVLFLATHMQCHSYGLATQMLWVRVCMRICVACIYVQLLSVFCVPIITGEVPEVNNDMSLVRCTPRSNNRVWMILAAATTWIGYSMMFIRLGCTMAICVSTVILAGKIHKEVSPATKCTVFLTVVFFLVRAKLAVGTIMVNQGLVPKKSRMIAALRAASHVIMITPMICILFMGARIRALQITGHDGAPQRWAQICFYICTAGITLQTYYVVCVPLFLGQDSTRRSGDKDLGVVDIQIAGWETGPRRVLLEAVQYVPMVMTYGGAVAVMVSIFLMKHPTGFTRPVSPAMRAVMALTLMYFIVYILLAVSEVAFVAVEHGGFKNSPMMRALSGHVDHPPDKKRHHRGQKQRGNAFFRTLECAKATVHLCPMLAVLFLGLRMHALDITSGQGAPQGWAQDCMYFCCAAVLLQLLMVAGLGLALGDAPPVDDNGVITNEGKSSKLLATAAVVNHFLSFFFLYGSAIGVCVALLIITPETATGRGSSLGTAPLCDGCEGPH